MRSSAKSCSCQCDEQFPKIYFENVSENGIYRQNTGIYRWNTGKNATKYRIDLPVFSVYTASIFTVSVYTEIPAPVFRYIPRYILKYRYLTGIYRNTGILPVFGILPVIWIPVNTGKIPVFQNTGKIPRYIPKYRRYIRYIPPVYTGQMVWSTRFSLVLTMSVR